jgi:hypothetical protein
VDQPQGIEVVETLAWAGGFTAEQADEFFGQLSGAQEVNRAPAEKGSSEIISPVAAPAERKASPPTRRELKRIAARAARIAKRRQRTRAEGKPARNHRIAACCGRR